MYPDPPPKHPRRLSSCYFTIVVPPSSSSAHFTTDTTDTTDTPDTPDITPVSECSPQPFALPVHRRPTLDMASPMDASRLLQLQTSAAHRPTAEPLQHSARASAANALASRSSSTDSGSASTPPMLSPAPISCCRCRRESLMGMIQFSTNMYYCSHCARMVGYSAG